MIKLGAVRRKIGSVRVDIEDEEENGGCQEEARAEGGPDRRIEKRNSRNAGMASILRFARGLGTSAVQRFIAGRNGGR